MSKFNVGDKVEVLRESPYVRRGAVGVITARAGSFTGAKDFRVECAGQVDYFLPDELRLVETKSSIPPQTAQTTKFKLGEVVKFQKFPGNNNASVQTGEWVRIVDLRTPFASTSTPPAIQKDQRYLVEPVKLVIGTNMYVRSRNVSEVVWESELFPLGPDAPPLPSSTPPVTPKSALETEVEVLAELNRQANALKAKIGVQRTKVNAIKLLQRDGFVVTKA